VAAARRATIVDQVFDDRPPRLKTLARAMRLHQWAKNLLVFVPLAAGHRLLDPSSFAQAAIAFLAFGCCASAVYLINDALDLPADRANPRKRTRALAWGDLAISTVLWLAPTLLVAAGLLAATLPARFGGLLGLYFAITLAYSMALRQVELLDVLVLAGLYTLRVLAGAAASRVQPSFWLLAFSMFLFLSLALTKRVSELADGPTTNALARTGRGYVSGDLEVLRSLGAAAGYLSVLVLALYINSRDVVIMYARPAALWLLCPLLLYWISRIWLVTTRGQLREDPLVFALEDRVSWGACLLAGLILVVATG
jgi:4-hydroxybenzoate polyprenyltransferase